MLSNAVIAVVNAVVIVIVNASVVVVIVDSIRYLYSAFFQKNQ